jgi:hypothetical protein
MTPISKERFAALCRSKLPSAEDFVTELEWFSDHDERVLGIVVIDNTDKDWSWMVLGRDEAGLFRAIDLGVSISTREEARALLATKLTEHSETGESIFPQGDVERDSMDLFESVAPEASLHKNYCILRETAHHHSAREILRELARPFIDVDGNFLKDFQTTGFNARLWELYLNAFLDEQRFSLIRDYDRPDFLVSKGGYPIAIEAVTVNATVGEEPPSPEKPEEIEALKRDYMPIKFGSVLYSKLQKRYWELPHVTDIPLVFAIHDFHGNDSMTWTSGALDDYLFGLRATWHKDANGKLHVTESQIGEHIWGNKTIPSGFFNQPNSEHISAVIFSNSATLSKFNRMGKLAGFGSSNVEMFRSGFRHDFNPDATVPIPFYVKVDSENYSEDWTDGVRIFHNPRARIPIPHEFFPGCSHHFIENGTRVSVLPEGFIHSSVTIVMLLTDDLPQSNT